MAWHKSNVDFGGSNLHDGRAKGAPTISGVICRSVVPCLASFMSRRRLRSAGIMRRSRAERPRTRTRAIVGMSPEISSCGGMVVNSSGT